ncbi:MAG: hypothetical protein Ct9H300mP1_18490 [Planctomycetaceae bacterium]|nr:MAG: hypothetical protein Ct9H300mP1_18490 [Planctomycetaceae bacterium]
MVEFLQNPDKYQALGAEFLAASVVGPPGTGKTLLAKAVAGGARGAVLRAQRFGLRRDVRGGLERPGRDMFQQAAARSPAIIFIDELDALGKVRGSGMPGGHESGNRLSSLLVEMDGFRPSKA